MTCLTIFCITRSTFFFVLSILSTIVAGLTTVYECVRNPIGPMLVQ
jgi:hypothetical protein